MRKAYAHAESVKLMSGSTQQCRTKDERLLLYNSNVARNRPQVWTTPGGAALPPMKESARGRGVVMSENEPKAGSAEEANACGRFGEGRRSSSDLTKQGGENGSEEGLQGGMSSTLQQQVMLRCKNKARETNLR
jgi:hypothetical protein